MHAFALYVYVTKIPKGAATERHREIFYKWVVVVAALALVIIEIIPLPYSLLFEAFMFVCF